MVRITSRLRRLNRILLLCCLVSGVLYGCSPNNHHKEVPELRGVWMQAYSIDTPKKVAEMLARIEAGHLNAVFVNVFADGYAYYESTLLEKHPDIEPGYDPLAYVIAEAHRRDIAVHAWLVAGPVDYYGELGPILTQHPDWSMIGPDGRQSYWLNYIRPDVRQFISDLVLEIVNNYDVEGVHFDYTRYPGFQYSFDPYSVKASAQEYGADLELLRGSGLPAYATFIGNPLAGVDTAQVLAQFDNGRPAVLLNNFGKGKVVLFNWDADVRQIAVSSEIFGRSVRYLAGENNNVYLLRSETNAQEYGYDDVIEGLAWIKDVGYSPIEVTESELATLSASGVLVMPNVYLISTQVASDLADFVRRGGGLIFIDGPTPSIEDRNLQTITGMRTRGRHFREEGLLIAVGEHELIPRSNQEEELTIAEYQALTAQWRAFRRQSINKLLHEVYQRLKREAPDVLVTVAVGAEQEILAEEDFLDWQAWLEGEYVDLIIVMAYVEHDEPLAPIIAGWQPIIQDSDWIALGLKTHVDQDEGFISKAPERVLCEVAIALASGAKGIVLFDVERTSDDALEALGTAPF